MPSQSILSKLLCPRCSTGIDDDGDGNCRFCANLSDDRARAILEDTLLIRRWARLIVVTGTRSQIDNAKSQSKFVGNKTLGNVSSIDINLDLFPEIVKFIEEKDPSVD